MTLYWWFCDRCGYREENKPELSWAEAARDWHISQCHRDAQWQAFELRVSFYRFRDAH